MGLGLSLSKDGGPFNCSTCTEKELIGRNCDNRLGLSEKTRTVNEYTEEITAELAESGARRVFVLGRIRLYECPLTYISRETHEIIRLIYLIEDTKELLFDGGWANQPYWLVEAFEIYKAEYIKAKSNG